MNHIYQRYLKLSSGLVAEARESYQLAKGECREVLFRRYMELQNEMEHYDYILSQSRMKCKAEESSLKPTIIPLVQEDYKAKGEVREICKPQTLCSSDTLCLWKEVYKHGSLSNQNCKSCSGYNPLCDKFYSNQSRGAKPIFTPKSKHHFCTSLHHDKFIDLVSIIRNSADGVWAE
jgi:hypothetical protein